MKRIIIICEGGTEREFCEKILLIYFLKKNIHIQAPLIKKTRGGIVKWSVLKKEIQTYLLETNVYVSLFIDYYGIDASHNFPKWEESLKIVDKYKRLEFLDQAMQDDISDAARHRFIPNIQLHEFEGLLFSDKDVFYQIIPKKELVAGDELNNTFAEYGDNPEMINDTKESSPSNRMQRIIKGYDKILYGHYLAEAIGLDKIRSKCQRFNNWLSTLENVA